jgi:hypothetical protein
MISSTVNDNIRSIFPFKAKMFVSLSRLNRTYEAPRLSILYTIAQEWRLPKEILNACVDSAELQEQTLIAYTRLSGQSESNLCLEMHDTCTMLNDE